MKSWICNVLGVSMLLAGAAGAADKPAAKPAAAAAAAVDSLALLEKAVARDSSHFDNLLRLGLLYMDRDRPHDAVRVLTRAGEVRPKDARVLVNLGAAFDAQGSTIAAQNLYEKALEIAPGDPIATCRLASSLYGQGKHGEAVQLLRGVIRETPRAHCAYFTLGVAFADAGIYREAINMWQKVVEIAPNSPEAASARESIDVLKRFVSK